MAIEVMKKTDPEDPRIPKASEAQKKMISDYMEKKKSSLLSMKKKPFIATADDEKPGEPVRQPSEEWDDKVRARNARARAAFHEGEIQRVDDYLSKKPIGEGNPAYAYLAAQRKDAAMKRRKAQTEAEGAEIAVRAGRRKGAVVKKAPADWDDKKDIKTPEKSSLESSQDLDYGWEMGKKQSNKGYGRGYYIKEGTYEDDVPFTKKKKED